MGEESGNPGRPVVDRQNVLHAFLDAGVDDPGPGQVVDEKRLNEMLDDIAKVRAQLRYRPLAIGLEKSLNSLMRGSLSSIIRIVLEVTHFSLLGYGALWREGQRHDRSVTQFTFDLQVSTVHFHQLLADRQPKT